MAVINENLSYYTIPSWRELKKLVKSIVNDFKDFLKRDINPQFNSNYFIFSDNSKEIEEFNDFVFEVWKNKIYDLSNKISISLKREHILIDEYYNFKEIERMMKNVIENESPNLKERQEIVTNLLNELCNIDNFKSKLFSQYDDISFDNLLMN